MAPDEYSERMEDPQAQPDVHVRVGEANGRAKGLPRNARWQRLLKSGALLHPKFREVRYLDAESFPVMDSECESGHMLMD